MQVKHIIDVVKVDPNSPSQLTREVAPQVIASGGCCGAKIYDSGAAGSITPLMFAAKGASLDSLKVR